MTKEPLSHTVLKEVGFSLLAEGKSIRVSAEGFSMYPTIKPGSVIFIEPLKKETEPVPGEIIAWKKEAGFIVHRLVRIIDEEHVRYFITRGDSSIAEDEPVTSDQVAGKVVRVENAAGIAIKQDVLLDKNPNYRLNRFLVQIISQIYRAKKVFNLSSG
jgi:signal peptidase I